MWSLFSDRSLRSKLLPLCYWCADYTPLLLTPSLNLSLQEHVPFEADMAVPPSAELPRVCTSPEFIAFAEHVKRDFQVSIVANSKSALANGGSGSESLPEYSFKFRCQRSNSDFLITAREMLEQFLLNHNIHVYPSPTAHTHKRGDSFAEAFPHFDSKVLSTARTRGKYFFVFLLISTFKGSLGS